MENSPQNPLPPYQPTPNTPPPPGAPPAPGSSFNTVTPSAQSYDAQAPGAFGAPPQGGFPLPEQKKSNTGRIIALIIGGILLLGAIFVGLGIWFVSSLDFDVNDPINNGLTSSSLEDTTRFDPFNGNEIRATGSISSGTHDAFEIELQEGERIVITAVAPDFDLDTILTVRDSSGRQVARNDDHSGAGLPSTLDSQVIFVPSATEVYTIEVADFANNDSGAYELTIGDAVG